jgi:hypothetical protein
LFRRGQRRQQIGKAGGGEGGCGFNRLLHGLENTAREGWEREENPMCTGTQVLD